MKNSADIFRIESITALNEILQQDKTRHPLVSVVDLSRISHQGMGNKKFSSGFYSIFLKNQQTGKLKYGREHYDFQEGTLLFLAPDQVIEIEEEPETADAPGWALFFHPDLLKGTSLSIQMDAYSFFKYEVHEALHVSDHEKQTLTEIIEKIGWELSQNIDKHSNTLIVSNIELLLNYCNRFYDRQFITRAPSGKNILSQFENILIEYFNSEELMKMGLPGVKYCADKLHLSANYLSDLLKKETGKNAQEHIHSKFIEIAKNRLLLSPATINEIAFELGFEYPQYFNKLFKSKTGMTPGEFRNMN